MSELIASSYSDNFINLKLSPQLKSKSTAQMINYNNVPPTTKRTSKRKI